MALPYASSSSPMAVPPARSAKLSEFQRRLNEIQKSGQMQGSVSVDGPRESDAQLFQRDAMGEQPNYRERARIPDAGGMAPQAPRRGPTVIPNSRTNRATIYGDEAMTPDQRSRVADMATSEQGYRAPLTGTNLSTGESFVMPQGGPRVSQNKAKSFLALSQQQDAAAEEKRRADRQFVADQTERQSRADMQTRDQDLKSQIVREERKNLYDDRLAKRDRSGYEFERLKKGDERADIMAGTPQQEQERKSAEAILSNPNATPRVKAMAAAILARSSGLPQGLSDELNKLPPEAIAGSASFAGKIPVISSLMNDVADVGAMNANAAPDKIRRLLAVIKDSAVKVAQDLDITPEEAEAAFVTEIMPQVNGLPPGVRRQILSVLTGGEAGGQERSALGTTFDAAKTASSLIPGLNMVAPVFNALSSPRGANSPAF